MIKTIVIGIAMVACAVMFPVTSAQALTEKSIRDATTVNGMHKCYQCKGSGWNSSGPHATRCSSCNGTGSSNSY